MEKIKVAIVGCGFISTIYLENLTTRYKYLEVYAVSDLVKENAEKQAKKYGIAHIMTFEEIINCKEIDIVVILTTPNLHYKMCKQALESGKNVYTEKPLALNVKDAKELVELASKNNVLLGGAPDTFMGAGLQTARKAIDDGLIGKPISCSAFFTCPGHERWHPNPDFYYKKGAGPVFDMGPYYLTALVSLLGSVEEVSSFTLKPHEQRTITSQPRCGEKIDVEIDTTMGGVLKFSNGTIGTILMSFDIEATNLPYIEIYGTKGSMSVSNPDYFDGPILVRNKFNEEFKELPLMFDNKTNSRGLGIANMAQKLLDDSTPLRPNDEIQLHVVEIMTALENREHLKTNIQIESKVERPAAM